MKRRIVIGILAAILVAGGIFFFLYRKSKAPTKPSDVNFSEIGNLAFNNPGLDPDTWYLIYEKPGEPALSALLKFDSSSSCLSGPCPGEMQSGERVKVEGVATTSVVLVRDISTDISQGNQESVALFYYNPLNDIIPGTRNIACSANGLTPVSRVIPKTNTPIQDTINLLLRGEISPDEKGQGLSTWFPLPQVKLTGENLDNGVLTLTFDDPMHNTDGGACRAAVMWGEIEATAKQFPGVDQVKFLPATLFQP